MMIKLNLGCGQRPLEGYVNVDMREDVGADLVFDLEIFPWPWEDNSVEEIQMTHVLEHLGRHSITFLNIITEIHRTLVPNGKLIAKVPHPRSDGFLGDPTHIRPIMPVMMALFSKKNCQRNREMGWPNTPFAEMLDIDLELIDVNYNLTPHWGERLKSGEIDQGQINYAIESFFNVVDEITLTMQKIE